jgi:hypothetical protein
VSEDILDTSDQFPPLNSYEDVAALYNDADKQSHLAYQGLMTMPGLSAQDFYRTYVAAEENQGDPLSLSDRTTLIGQYAHEHLDEQGLVDAHDALAGLDRATRMTDYLDRAGKEFCVSEIVSQEDQLVHGIDWGRVVDTAAGRPEHYDDQVTPSIAAALVERPDSTASVTTLVEHANRLRQGRERLSEEGFERPDNIPRNSEDERVYANTAQVLRDWNRSNIIASGMTLAIRGKRLEDTLPRTTREIEQLAKFAESAGLDSDTEKRINTPVVIAQAIRHRAIQTIRQFDQADTKIREELYGPSSRHANMLMVKNPELLHDLVGIGDPADPLFSSRWLTQQLALYPPQYRKGLGRIVATDGPPISEHGSSWTEETSKELLDPKTEGNFFVKQNTLRLNLGWRAEELKKVFPDNILEQHTQHAEALQFTVAHEVMHKVHAELPISWLRSWVDIVDSEPVDVTDYVTQKRESAATASIDDKASKRLIVERYNEDLCDTAALYLHSPGELFLVAPERFAGINTFFNEYSDKALSLFQHLRTTPTLEDDDRRNVLELATKQERVRATSMHEDHPPIGE